MHRNVSIYRKKRRVEQYGVKIMMPDASQAPHQIFKQTTITPFTGVERLYLSSSLLFGTTVEIQLCIREEL